MQDWREEQEQERLEVLYPEIYFYFAISLRNAPRRGVQRNGVRPMEITLPGKCINISICNAS